MDSVTLVRSAIILLQTSKALLTALIINMKQAKYQFILLKHSNFKKHTLTSEVNTWLVSKMLTSYTS